VRPNKKSRVDPARIVELRRLKAHRLARVLELAEDGAAALQDLDLLLLLAKAEGRDESSEPDESLEPATTRSVPGGLWVVGPSDDSVSIEAADSNARA